jgi:hypothetical protein
MVWCPGANHKAPLRSCLARSAIQRPIDRLAWNNESAESLLLKLSFGCTNVIARSVAFYAVGTTKDLARDGANHRLRVARV